MRRPLAPGEFADIKAITEMAIPSSWPGEEGKKLVAEVERLQDELRAAKEHLRTAMMRWSLFAVSEREKAEFDCAASFLRDR